MRWGDGFIIVYDITDRGSFEDVAPLRSLLEEVKKPKNVPLVLVGNKSDLDHVRQVATEEGERLAAEMACAFYECSACADEGGAVAEAFHELCREVRRQCICTCVHMVVNGLKPGCVLQLEWTTI
uniref:small monomeric GTPase n=1 Tax=Oryzias latipes TaxID=8090 RepID=H2LZJ4_ORYLA